MASDDRAGVAATRSAAERCGRLGHAFTDWKPEKIGYLWRRCPRCGLYQRRTVERPESIRGVLREIRMERRGIRFDLDVLRAEVADDAQLRLLNPPDPEIPY